MSILILQLGKLWRKTLPGDIKPVTAALTPEILAVQISGDEEDFRERAVWVCFFPQHAP